MLDFEVVQNALRARLRTLVVCTTGSTTLRATATGYARDTGSFLTDGFCVGMEVTPLGFPQTAVGVISDLTDLTLTILGGRTVATSQANRTLTVTIPSVAQFGVPIVRQPNRPYFIEQFSPSIAPIVGGYTEDRGLYPLTWYGLTDFGELAIMRSMRAVRALFTPNTTIGTGVNAVLIRGVNATPPSEIIAGGDGWSRSTFKPEWYAFTRNTVAA